MKVLVTGGCGFLGSNIAAAYIGDGADVVVLDALFRTGSEANLAWLKTQANSRNLVFERGDIAESDCVDSVFRRHGPFDYVCHLAGQVAMTTSLTNPRRDLLTNAVGTFNVLEAVRALSPEALVAYSSTNKVYGDLRNLIYEETPTRYIVPSHPRGFDETLPLDFASPYGCSKGAADQYARDWFRNFGVKTVVFRHSSIYGGRQFATFDQGWIGWFCQQAVAQREAREQGREPETFTISGSGKQVRDVLHAGDLIRLYKAAFNHRGSCAGEIFNIGGGMASSLSLLELFALLQRLACNGHPLSFQRLQRRQSDQDFFVADIDKAHRLLGWMPQVAVEDGIGRMLQWTQQDVATG
jgi:CDP-paratose 2-epimerase